jgi:ABC-2 type transport system ATP-binding protein
MNDLLQNSSDATAAIEPVFSSEAIVTASHLSKVYKHSVALTDFSFQILPGQIIGLVGKNGAGKTTLIRLLTGVARPTKGTFTLFGKSSAKDLTEALSKVAAMVEQPALYENLTATQNLMTRCLLMGVEDPMGGYIRDKLAFVGLPEAYLDKRKVKDYSLGMRQRVGIAMSMVGEPKLMILDEPTNGLDPEGIRQIRELLLKLNQEAGVTMLISSHILSELSKFATDYMFIDNGKLIQQISAPDLEKAVGKVLILKTSDDPKSAALIADAHYDVETIKGSLYVHDVKEPATVINLLSAEKISLLGMKEEENSLEDYFLNLIGGRR